MPAANGEERPVATVGCVENSAAAVEETTTRKGLTAAS